MGSWELYFSGGDLTMPYIEKKYREAILERKLGELEHIERFTPGDLNYILTIVLSAYIRRKGLSYTTLNDILGAFEGAKLEYYRRVAVPYENPKLAENGDVYDY
jgi:hypothetical protein